jgi:hypothetical protein
MFLASLQSISINQTRFTTPADPFAAAARCPLLFRSNPQPAVSQSVQVRLKAWKLRDKLNGVIEVSRLKDVKAAKLFLGLRIGAVSRGDFAVFPVQRHRSLRTLQRHFGNRMSVGAQMIVVLKTVVEYCISLGLGHPFEFPWLEVSQTDEFHQFLTVSYDSESRSASFCYQIVVRVTENRQLLHFFAL